MPHLECEFEFEFEPEPAAWSTNACPATFDDDEVVDDSVDGDVDEAGTVDAADACTPSPPFLARGLGLLASVFLLGVLLGPLPDFADDAALAGHDCHAGAPYRRHRYLPIAVEADADLIVDEKVERAGPSDQRSQRKKKQRYMFNLRVRGPNGQVVLRGT